MTGPCSGLARFPPHHPGMDRRRFLLTSLAGAVVGPLAAGAQPAGKMYRIGLLSWGPRMSAAGAFVDEKPPAS